MQETGTSMIPMKAENPDAACRRPVFQEKRKSAGYAQIRDRYAVLLVAVTFIIMDYSTLFGFLPIVLFYAIWFPHILYKKRFTLSLSKDIYPAALLAVLCVVSVLWSDYRYVTDKAALEFASMIACAIVIARVTGLQSFLQGVAMGASLALIASLVEGTYGMDYFTGSYALIGLFGSKNQIGFNAEIGMFAATLLLFSKSHPAGKMLFSLFPLALCLVSLYLSRSASSAVTLAATLAVCGGAYFLGRLPRRVRKPALMAGLFLATLITVAGLNMGWQDAVLGAFGKNSTLTGRTYLWAKGYGLGMQKPFLGYGFAAFWVEGQPLAEALWYKFGIFNRTGFHFHSLFVQSFVDLGITGLLLIAFILLSGCIRSINYVIENGAGLLAFYALGMSFMFLARAFVEVDLLGPFGIGPLLFFSILPRLAVQHDPAATVPNPARKDGNSIIPLRGQQ
jgi:exopolysaccharide production protein ExoQ